MVSTVVNFLFEIKTTPITHTHKHTHNSKEGGKTFKNDRKIFTNNKITPKWIYQQQQKQNRKIWTFYDVFRKAIVLSTETDIV